MFSILLFGFKSRHLNQKNRRDFALRFFCCDETVFVPPLGPNTSALSRNRGPIKKAQHFLWERRRCGEILSEAKRLTGEQSLRRRRDQEVVGSSPVTSTKKTAEILLCGFFGCDETVLVPPLNSAVRPICCKNILGTTEYCSPSQKQKSAPRKHSLSGRAVCSKHTSRRTCKPGSVERGHLSRRIVADTLKRCSRRYSGGQPI